MKLHPQRPRRILHVDMDAFFVSVERALHAELKGLPLIVGGEPGQRGVVASASYEVRPYGVRSGMPLSQARRLCPQALFVRGSFEAYQRCSERLVEIFHEITPDVEPLSLDEAFLDLTGFDSLYGPAVETARRLKRRIRDELGITASIGIATNKVVAKVASDLDKPDGLVEVPPGEEASFLAPLAVERLPGVGPVAARTLHRIGVHTLGQLTAMAPEELKRLFGAWGLALHHHANGLDGSPVAAREQNKSIGRSTTFARDTRDRAFLHAILSYLGERVCAQLREEGRLARCITLVLRFADFETITRQRSLGRPTSDGQEFFRVARDLLECNLAATPKLVRLVGVAASHLVPEALQLPLLDLANERQTRLNRCLDCLRGRHGFTVVQRGLTLALEGAYPKRGAAGYVLQTPALSR